MTVSNTLVKQTYTVADGNDTYAIPFDFFTTSEVTVYVGTTLQTYGESEDYTYSEYSTDDRGNYLPANIVFTAASQPVDGATVTVKRAASITQTEDFLDGDPVPQDQFEDMGDKLCLRIQEVEDDLERQLTLPIGSSISGDLGTLTAGEFLKVNAAGDEIESEDIDLTTIEANIATNVADIATNGYDITLLKSRMTDAESDIDTLETNTSTYAASIGTNSSNITTNQNNILINTNAIAALDTRLTAVELLAGNVGSQTLLNNQAASVDLTDLVFDGDDYDYILIEYAITRNTDSNYKFEAGTLHMAMRGNAVWTFENGLQVIDIAGITFAVATQAGNVGQMSYTSDDLAGTSYSGKIRYNIKKFEA